MPEPVPDVADAPSQKRGRKPLDRLIRLEEVMHVTSLSRTSIWRLEGVGKFPKRTIVIGRTPGWRESEILAWLESRFALRK